MDKIFEFSYLSRMPECLQGLFLYLAYTLTADLKELAYIVQCVRMAVFEAQTPLQYISLPGWKGIQRIHNYFPQHVSVHRSCGWALRFAFNDILKRSVLAIV